MKGQKREQNSPVRDARQKSEKVISAEQEKKKKSRPTSLPYGSYTNATKG